MPNAERRTQNAERRTPNDCLSAVYLVKHVQSGTRLDLSTTMAAERILISSRYKVLYYPIVSGHFALHSSFVESGLSIECLYTDWRIWVTVTEQSHVFIYRWCCILISKVVVGYVFRVLLLDLLLFMFSDCILMPLVAFVSG